jgi:poly(3-hydroxybutyrate) depolymerase
MRIAIFDLVFTRLWLVIWLCGAMSSPALGGMGKGSDYRELTIPSTFQGSTYQIRVPDFENPNYQIPVVVILHDAGRNGAAITNDESLVNAFIDKGYAVLAPNALRRRNARIDYRGNRPGNVERESFSLPFSYSEKRFVLTGGDGTVRTLKYRTDSGWYFYNVDRVRYSHDLSESELLGRDEIQNLRNVLRNAEEEYGVNPEPVLIIGLGHGGSLVWQIACHAPNLGRVLAPVGGAYWRELPKKCKPGANLIHTHHRASAFWPLKGVKGRKKRYARTSIYRNVAMLLGANRCGSEKTTIRTDEFGASHTTWADCAGGGPVGLLLLDQRFAFQTWWLDEMLARVEQTDTDHPRDDAEEPTDISPEFSTPDSGTGFMAPGEGKVFQRPGSEVDSRFKRPK